MARIRIVLRRAAARSRRPGAACRSPTWSSTRTPARCGARTRPSSSRPRSSTCCHYLAANARRVLSKAQILDAVWQYDFDGDASVVETFVYCLRKKVDRFDPHLIHTVRGVGYVLRPPSA